MLSLQLWLYPYFGGKQISKKVIFSNNDAKLVIDSELNKVFNKHIKLGALIVMGSILIYLAGEFLTILMGVASALHQCFNNVYIFYYLNQISNGIQYCVNVKHRGIKVMICFICILCLMIRESLREIRIRHRQSLRIQKESRPLTLNHLNIIFWK
eukprot:TRINITY_DN1952_c0_g1_i1.p1 TRINITY_DN1952_c0_g1~~TRINITY_DN1952_c0_g1_i1.p1  ORF type:complete len:155 (+),score=17.47 TRINITY_DN1952_c0_g1_i1:234-698(+)